MALEKQLSSNCAGVTSTSENIDEKTGHLESVPHYVKSKVASAVLLISGIPIDNQSRVS